MFRYLSYASLNLSTQNFPKLEVTEHRYNEMLAMDAMAWRNECKELGLDWIIYRITAKCGHDIYLQWAIEHGWAEKPFAGFQARPCSSCVKEKHIAKSKEKRDKAKPHSGSTTT